jgi:hypothetical protein
LVPFTWRSRSIEASISTRPSTIDDHLIASTSRGGRRCTGAAATTGRASGSGRRSDQAGDLFAGRGGRTRPCCGGRPGQPERVARYLAVPFERGAGCSEHCVQVVDRGSADAVVFQVAVQGLDVAGGELRDRSLSPRGREMVEQADSLGCGLAGQTA